MRPVLNPDRPWLVFAADSVIAIQLFAQIFVVCIYLLTTFIYPNTRLFQGYDIPIICGLIINIFMLLSFTAILVRRNFASENNMWKPTAWYYLISLPFILNTILGDLIYLREVYNHR